MPETLCLSHAGLTAAAAAAAAAKTCLRCIVSSGGCFPSSGSSQASMYSRVYVEVHTRCNIGVRLTAAQRRRARSRGKRGAGLVRGVRAIACAVVFAFAVLTGPVLAVVVTTGPRMDGGSSIAPRSGDGAHYYAQVLQYLYSCRWRWCMLRAGECSPSRGQQASTLAIGECPRVLCCTHRPPPLCPHHCLCRHPSQG